MPLVTKAEFAETLRVSRPRVSQYIKSGLPVRADGMIDLDAALHWVSRNVEPDADCGGASVVASDFLRERAGKGGTRPPAPSRRKGAPPTPAGMAVLDETDNLFEKGMMLGLLSLFPRVGALASIAAHGAGAERAVAERTGEVFSALFAQAATNMLAECGVQPVASNPDAMTWPHPDLFNKVNWKALGPPGEFARKAEAAE